jgi:mRNA interferase HigB
MRLIARKNLVEFGLIHPTARASALHLAGLIEASDWKTPAEAQASVSKAKVVGPDRLRFEIAGGQFRAIVAFDWQRQIAFVKFLGTHKEYDAVDAAIVAQF